MGTFRHNKKRNTGLVYEFLIRHLSQSMIDRRADVYQKTLGMIRRYYGDGSPLMSEHELFTVVQNTRGISEAAARRILGEIQRAAKTMDFKKIDIKKSNLIKEINHGFGQDFWDLHRVPEYRLLATIQMVIDSARSERRLTESVENIQLEEGLVNYMTTRNEYKSPTPPKEEIDQLVMAITAKKFQEKYSKSLNRSQQKLLEEYVRYQVTRDDHRFVKVVIDEEKRVKSILEKARNMSEFVTDPIMMKKLNEAHDHFNKITGHVTDVLDVQLENLMLYQSLVEEIESDA